LAVLINHDNDYLTRLLAFLNVINLNLGWIFVRGLGGEDSKDVGDAASHQQLHILRRVAEEVLVGQVNGQRGVVGVGGLILGLTEHLEGVRQGLEAANELVRAQIVGYLHVIIGHCYNSILN
jgi:hypothetical protein